MDDKLYGGSMSGKTMTYARAAQRYGENKRMFSNYPSPGEVIDWAELFPRFRKDKAQPVERIGMTLTRGHMDYLLKLLEDNRPTNFEEKYNRDELWNMFEAYLFREDLKGD
ncbi:hypothetical protein P9314_05160 [Paenibacillus validus]|uniref:hypothetical protein n=1 Tax=Paenibacillus validus TaxID=44253 RepID=UPI000FDAD318|nr:hypothetical protein [Paenibacillus validus]MED4600098.1 hypothetical protein [Paenibacillus validus]MED4605546.1 hypothetical protein [Paenibacillus validus]